MFVEATSYLSLEVGMERACSTIYKYSTQVHHAPHFHPHAPKHLQQENYAHAHAHTHPHPHTHMLDPMTWSKPITTGNAPGCRAGMNAVNMSVSQQCSDVITLSGSVVCLSLHCIC